MKKLSLFLLILLYSVNVFSTPIISGLGIIYKTPYEEVLKQLKEEGIEIEKTTKEVRGEGYQKLFVTLRPFVYRGISFSYGILQFIKDNDRIYKFITAEGRCGKTDETSLNNLQIYLDELCSSHRASRNSDGNGATYSGSTLGSYINFREEEDYYKLYYYPETFDLNF